MLSAVLGSVAVAAPAALALDGVDTVVLFTVVLVVVIVLGVAVAGFRAGSVADPAPGCPPAGPAPPAGSPAPPGTSRPSVSPFERRRRALATVTGYQDRFVLCDTFWIDETHINDTDPSKGYKQVHKRGLSRQRPCV